MVFIERCLVTELVALPDDPSIGLLAYWAAKHSFLKRGCFRDDFRDRVYCIVFQNWPLRPIAYLVKIERDSPDGALELSQVTG